MRKMKTYIKDLVRGALYKIRLGIYYGTVCCLNMVEKSPLFSKVNKLNSTLKIVSLLSLIVIYSCYQETSIPIVTDFDITFVNEDKSVPVRIKVANKTEGADTYEWSFEGAQISSSKDKNPGAIKYIHAGNYTITLKAINVDGEEDVIEKEITLFEAIDIDFSTEIAASNFSPVEVEIKNSTEGNTLSYLWEFEGGIPNTSTERHPENIVFTKEGEHTIKVTVSNEFESFTSEKKIEVLPKLLPDFNWEVAFFDDDDQAPVSITLFNESISATSYQWTFEKGNPSTSTEEAPKVTFTEAGIHKMVLEASNDKETKRITKTIEVLPNTNLRTFENIKLGINSAHNSNAIGAFFSASLRKVFTANEVTDKSEIDIAFLSLNKTFNFNKFLSPREVKSNGFLEIPNATHTKFINTQENCNCGVRFTETQFNAMNNDLPLQSILITETTNGLLHFNKDVLPRIVLFQTEDGRKGAIKIKEFVDKGTNSHIICDIKIQKLP